MKINHFSGIAPKISNRELAPGVGQLADNCRVISGALRSFADKLEVPTNTMRSGGDVKTIFRMSDGNLDYWLSWTKDVNCVRSQIAGDAAQRIYWTGDNEPRMSNLALAIAGGGVMPNSCFVLGVSPPTVKPTVTPSGGTGADVSRAYIETFVTQYGEESAPGPVSSVMTGKVDGTWALSGLNPAPINTAAISGATYAGGVVTVVTASTAHLRAGEELSHAGVVGMTDLNGNHVIASVVDATHYTVALTTAQTYTSGGTWTRVAPHNTSGMVRRIYRTLSGQYFFVAELPIATTNYNDTVADAALGEVCPSVGWTMPPADLKGLIFLPNGYNVGFSGNEICPSEPWHPHAFPTAYRQSCGFDIVGIGSFGSSIVVGTKGLPYILTGSHPSNLSMEKGRQLRPCLSKQSVVDVGVGVLYSSPDGLAFENGSGEDLATKGQFSRDEWKVLNPTTIRCVYHNGMVFGWHAQDANLHTGFAFDLVTGAFTSTSIPTTASYVDPETSALYVVSGGKVYQWDAHPYNDLTYDWKSGVYALPRPVNLGYAMFDAEFSELNAVNEAIAADTAWNTAVLASGVTDGMLDDTMLDEYMLDGSLLRGGDKVEYASRTLRFTLYADGQEKYSRTVSSNDAFSLPKGYKACNYELRISGNISVYSLTLAESATGLKNQ